MGNEKKVELQAWNIICKDTEAEPSLSWWGKPAGLKAMVLEWGPASSSPITRKLLGTQTLRCNPRTTE